MYDKGNRFGLITVLAIVAMLSGQVVAFEDGSAGDGGSTERAPETGDASAESSGAESQGDGASDASSDSENAAQGDSAPSSDEGADPGDEDDKD